MSTSTNAQHYDEAFYNDISGGSEQSAQVIGPMLFDMLGTKSVLDVGCGRGAWLKSFAKHGIQDYVGLDGDYVERDSLLIPPDHFQAADLTQPVALARRFDLAISMEVGEHLPDAAASTLVKTLCDHADVVLFSAAIPSQPGINHINGQWPSYWAEHFGANGFGWVDCVRLAVWQNEQVKWWYAQNAILYVRLSAAARFPKLPPVMRADTALPNSLVHPAGYEASNDELAALHEFRRVPPLPWSASALKHSLLASVRGNKNPSGK